MNFTINATPQSASSLATEVVSSLHAPAMRRSSDALETKRIKHHRLFAVNDGEALATGAYGWHDPAFVWIPGAPIGIPRRVDGHFNHWITEILPDLANDDRAVAVLDEPEHYVAAIVGALAAIERCAPFFRQDLHKHVCAIVLLRAPHPRFVAAANAQGVMVFVPPESAGEAFFLDSMVQQGGQIVFNAQSMLRTEAAFGPSECTSRAMHHLTARQAITCEVAELHRAWIKTTILRCVDEQHLVPASEADEIFGRLCFATWGYHTATQAIARPSAELCSTEGLELCRFFRTDYLRLAIARPELTSVDFSQQPSTFEWADFLRDHAALVREQTRVDDLSV